MYGYQNVDVSSVQYFQKVTSNVQTFLLLFVLSIKQ